MHINYRKIRKEVTYAPNASNYIKISVGYIINKHSTSGARFMWYFNITVTQTFYKTGNNLNQIFPALKFHIKKFNPTGTTRLQFRMLV
jgi:hypothetical protein